MRLFLLGWNHSRFDHVAVALNLQKQGHEIIYWTTVSEESKVDERKFPATIFHSHAEASRGIPAPKLKNSDFLPPSKDFIDQLHKVESLVLTMMNKRFDWMGTDERRHLFFNLVQYWNGVLEIFKPDAIIYTAIPHTVYDYIVYELAQRIGIKIVMFDGIMISDRYLILNDFRKGSSRFQDALEHYQTMPITVQDLSADIRRYYERQIDWGQDATPRYLQEDRKKNSASRVARQKIRIGINSFSNGSILGKLFGYFLKFFGNNIKKEYGQVQAKLDLNKKFIYLPLNYQPECTTSPQGDIFVDQILMVETVAASIPDDWLVYVKEHPGQWFPRGLNFSGVRYRGYYKKIAAINKVRVVPVETNSYELINKSQAVATVTGTAGWEAVLRSKPAIIFGYPWYQNCPGLLRADSVASCRRAISAIIGGFSIDQQAVWRFLKALDQSTFHAYFQLYIEKESTLTEDENTRNISRALLSEIEGN